MIGTRYGIMIAMLLLASIVFGASAQKVTPDKTFNPGDTVTLTGPTGSYGYTWTLSPTVSPAPKNTVQAFSFKIPTSSPAALYTVTLLVKSTVEGSCTNSRDILIAVNMPIAISGTKSVCVSADNEKYSVPDLTEGQTIEWSLSLGEKQLLDATNNNINPIYINWKELASGITTVTTYNLVAVVKNKEGNVVSTAPIVPVKVVPIPDTTVKIT